MVFEERVRSLQYAIQSIGAELNGCVMEDRFIGLVRGEISQLFLQFDTLQNLAPSGLFRLTATVDALHVGAIGPPKIFASL